MRKARSLVCLILAVFFLCVPAFAEFSAIGEVTENLRLRSQPDTGSETILTVSKGGKVYILDSELITNDTGSWYKTSYNSKEGYMSADYIKLVDVQNIDFGYGTLTANKVNFRAKPDTSSAINAILTEDTVVEITGREGDWYAAVYNGKGGYLFAEYVEFSIEAPVTAPAVTASAKVTGYTGGATSQDCSAAVNALNASNPTDTQRKIIETALEYIGYKYSYGTAGPKSFDCSGFTSYVYKKQGVSLSRSSVDQYKGTGDKITSSSNLVTGDLVFFRDASVGSKVVTHVGIYIGCGLFIHASSSSGRCVKISDLSTGYYKSKFVAGKRII